MTTALWAFWIILGTGEFVTGGFADEATCNQQRAWAIATIREQKAWGLEKATRAVSPCSIVK
jgi:hypothetical protein